MASHEQSRILKPTDEGSLGEENPSRDTHIWSRGIRNEAREGPELNMVD